jgi:hypothetical protein
VQLKEIYEPVSLTRPQDTAPYFVTCFSAAENSLNQWRAYGRGEGGYCLGFDSKQLDLKSSGGNFFISPAIYDRDVQAALVEDLLTWALAEYESVAVRHAENQDEHRKAWAHMLLWQATAIAPIMKNPGFSEENEWRLIHILQSKWDVRFVTKPSGLVPFVNLMVGTPQLPVSEEHAKRIGRNPPDKLPISVLWSGPGRAADISLFAGRTLLEQYGYYGVRLEASKIPFRVG